MRIACLQFAPQLGDIENNLNRADAVLSRANPRDIDLLVLPELAFSGYNFKSLKHITPYLEPTVSGISSLWARSTALKHNCNVIVGYPEKVDITAKWPTSPEYYNSAIIVNAVGETVANYRKTFLYYTDETWALEGPEGFFDGEIPGLGNVAFGICMDINPYKFEVPWSSWEFAYHVLHKEANLVILSMAWLTGQDARSYSINPQEPDMETLAYWLARLEPVIRAEDTGEIIVVFANRCGVEDEAVYAGTSAVLGIDNGEVKVYGVLGRGEKELLVVDTSEKPKAKLVSEQNSTILDNTDQHRIDVEPTPEMHDQEVPTSIDAVLAATVPISPVEPRFPHAYYASEPPKAEDVLSKLQSCVPITRSRSPPSSVNSPLLTPDPVANRTASPRSRNRSRSQISQLLQQEPTLASQKSYDEPDIVPMPTLGLKLNIDDRSPSPTSSMTTNTPWDNDLELFTAEDARRISMSSQTSTSPNSRELSRTRQPQQESALVPVDLENESELVPIIIMDADEKASPARQPTTKPTFSPPGRTPSTQDDRSMSRRPQSTGW